MSKREGISVVIPAYNEAENISPLLVELYHFLETRFRDFELLVIDDGSVDGTMQLAEATPRQAKLDPLKIKVIRHEQNRGYGGALRTGFYSARHEQILLYPGDRQFVVDEIQLLLEEAKKVKGKDPYVIWPYRARRAEGGLRRLNAALYHRLIGWALGVDGVRDIDCGMKLYHRDLFNRIPKLISEGALIDAEILTHCRKLHISIRQLPLTHVARRAGTATGANLRVIVQMFTELRKFRTLVAAKPDINL